MSSEKRKENESYEEYKNRLKKEEKELKQYLKGTFIWYGAFGPYRKGTNK